MNATTRKIVDAATDAAVSRLTARQHNGYAAAVLRGYQNWSGSDLAGAAKKYGAGYAKQRRDAMLALRGLGYIVSTEHGRLCTAVVRGQDDFGNAILCTRDGTVVLNPRSSTGQYMHVGLS